MTLDERITQAAARAAIAARNGDDDAWREWSEEATRLLDQRDQTDRAIAQFSTLGAPVACLTTAARIVATHYPTFDELKGSPDHSRVPS